MRRTHVTLWGLMLAVPLALAGLCACGGGGSGGQGGDAVVAELPQGPPRDDPAAPPPSNPPTSPGETPAPAPGENPGDAPSEPGEGPEPVLPAPPVPLPAWQGLPDIHALALDPTQGGVWAIAATHGEVYHLEAGALEPRHVGTTGLAGVRGLAFDPTVSALYAVVDGAPNPDDRLVRIETATLEVVALGPIAGYGAVEGLAYHSPLERLFAVDTDAGVLLRIEPAGVVATEVGPLGAFTNLAGLAPDPEGPRLFATDKDSATLVTVDVDTGATARRCQTDPAAIEALAYDPLNARFYGSAVDPGRLFAFDPIGAWMRYAEITGLTFDAARDRILGCYRPGGLIVEIDPDSQWKQVVGYVPVSGLEGLAYDVQADRLFAISPVTQSLYLLSPTDGTIEAERPILGAAAPFTGLASLTWAGGRLYATDRDSDALIEIEPPTGNARVLATIGAWPRIEGLAYDPVSDTMHGFSNDGQAHVRIERREPFSAKAVSQGVHDDVQGLAWIAETQELYGSVGATDALALVHAPEPSALGYEDLRSLAFHAGSGRLVGFDVPTATFVEIEPTLQLGIPFRTWEGSRIEGMAFDPGADVLLVVDGATGTLLEVDRDWASTVVGTEGTLSPYDVKAIAYDPDGGILYGVDDASDHLLRIDRETGLAELVDPAGPGLGFGSVEALGFDAARGTLVGLDRESRQLLTIDPAGGPAAAVATVEAAHVRGLTLVGDEPYLWLADGDQVVAVDRETGARVVPLAVGPEPRHASAAPAVRLLWPRGAVCAEALDCCALEVAPGHEGRLSVEFVCGGELIHRTTFEPEHEVAHAEIPAAVRGAIAEGETVTWTVAGQTAEFEVVEAADARARIADILGHPTMRERSDWERRLVEALLLDRHRLHTEALRMGLATFEAYPDRRASALSLLRTLHHLDLGDSRVGGEARASMRRGL